MKVKYIKSELGGDWTTGGFQIFDSAYIISFMLVKDICLNGIGAFIRFGVDVYKKGKPLINLHIYPRDIFKDIL